MRWWRGSRRIKARRPRPLEFSNGVKNNSEALKFGWALPIEQVSGGFISPHAGEKQMSMAVNGISQPQVAPPDSTLDLASQRAQHAGSKANTAQATGGV